MWRTTVNLTSKLSSTTTTSPNNILKKPFLLHSINVNLTLTSRSHTLISSSSNTTAPISDHVKLGFPNSDLSRSISTTATDLSSVSSAALSVSKTRSISTTATDLSAVSSSALSVSKTRDVVDAARHYGRCYWELSKARLSMLVVATSGTGYVLGSGSVIDYAGLGLTCAGTMMVAASANSLNQVFEIKNDAAMKRTMQRPLPSGRLTRQHAVTWACSVGLAGTALLACKANVLAAGLGTSTLFLYAFVYTPLKQIHPINTWVGAVVGALPPLLGWAAASGQVSMNGMLLPAALYFWQIPHFMALAYLCRNDYAAGGFKMLSLADASGHKTALVALRNCIYLVPLGFLAYDWGITSGWFCLESSLLAAAISATAFSFYRNRTMKSARKMFHASLLYLPVFMSGLLFHRITYNDSKECLSLDSSVQNSELPISSEIMVADENDENKRKHSRVKRESRAPVSYASVAPFPFLPAPSYAYP